MTVIATTSIPIPADGITISIPGDGEINISRDELIWCAQMLKGSKARMTMEVIARFVAGEQSISVDALIGASHKRIYVDARRLFIKLVLDHTEFSLMAIGNYLNRDHSSIIHLRDTFNGYLSVQPKLKREYDASKERLMLFNKPVVSQ